MCGKDGKGKIHEAAARMASAGCPPAPPGFTFTGIIIQDGECFCVYKNDNDPTDIILRPCT